MSFADRLRESIAAYLRNMGYEVQKVTGFEDDTESGGYCETCYYEWAVVRIEYVDLTGRTQEYVYDGEFGELIRELT